MNKPTCFLLLVILVAAAIIGALFLAWAVNGFPYWQVLVNGIGAAAFVGLLVTTVNSRRARLAPLAVALIVVLAFVGAYVLLSNAAQWLSGLAG